MSWISMNVGGLPARQGPLNFGHCLTVIKLLWSQQQRVVIFFFFFNHSKSEKHFLTDQNLCSIYSQS